SEDRAFKEQVRLGAEMAADLQMQNSAEKAALDEAERAKGAERRRKESYIDDYTQTPGFSVNLGALGETTVRVPSRRRVGFLGAIKRERYLEAARMRKKM